MDGYNTDVFKKMLDPKFSFENFDMETLAELGREANEITAIRQRILGRLAMMIPTKYGDNALKEFAKEVGLSYPTIQNYRWVESRTAGLAIPDDFTFTARQTLAGTEKPQEWLQKALDEGWSSRQLISKINLEKGTGRKVRQCPNCGALLTKNHDTELETPVQVEGSSD